MPASSQPTGEQQRIASLDVLRGFALLGILLLNIIGMGLASPAYSNPGFDVHGGANLLAWAGVELFAEGAMRGLFSLLFGAGVVLFSDGRSGSLYARRTGLLLVFGLFDAYVLLWNGDILVTYALAGFLLWPLRNWRPRGLLVLAAVLLVLQILWYTAMAWGLGELRAAGGAGWQDFASDFQPSAEALAAELAARRDGYASAFIWNAAKTTEMLAFVLPLFLLWDALLMMVLGMAFYRLGLLQGQRSQRLYLGLAASGFLVGLLANGAEVTRALAADMDLLAVFAQANPSYHIGRLGMACGWMGLVLWLCGASLLPGLRARLAAVGRMALTNYLAHSVIALLLFTGAGLALVGQLSRAELYLIVPVVWALQLWWSPWWLARYRFGPAEWLWRAMTYGQRPPLSRAVGAPP